MTANEKAVLFFTFISVGHCLINIFNCNSIKGSYQDFSPHFACHSEVWNLF